MTLPLTPAQFAALKQALSTAPNVSLTTLSDTTGMLTTQGVTLGYSYDGSNLAVTIQAKHGIAAFAPDSVIYDEIDKLMQNYVAAAAA
jgi:hypothetical protein